jgi:hypothetical protein
MQVVGNAKRLAVIKVGQVRNDEIAIPDLCANFNARRREERCDLLSKAR